ncbi:MAG: ATP synthase subunit I [Glaciimonas sp.]|nr:ATP synthase subunit I [Glaciimonas sp.]
MNEALTLMLAWVAGTVLGTIFFGGLWWTVRKSVAARQPALWVFGSLLLRMSIALAGFYFVSGGQLKRLMACILGFFIARLAVSWLTRLPVENQKVPPAQAASHAP